MTTPAISVMTVAYNAEQYLEQCMESICNQTFSDFEYIIVNDASTDRTGEILENWRKRDSRIKILTNSTNRGRPLTRNRALTAATAPLVAVLDADDYSSPNRLERQYEFFREHPHVQILGADMKIHGTEVILTHPRNNDEIRADLFFDSSLFHSTVMMRKSILTATKSWYDAAMPLAQDYGLWVSLMFSPQAIFANLPEALTTYREAESPRPGYREKQFNYANKARGKILDYLGLKPTRHDMACHLALLYSNAGALGVTPGDCAAWGEKLSEANSGKPLANPAALNQQIYARLAALIARDMGEREKSGPKPETHA